MLEERVCVRCSTLELDMANGAGEERIGQCVCYVRGRETYDVIKIFLRAQRDNWSELDTMVVYRGVASECKV